mgnify:CR=1 FL=1|jgi:hypothetical protein
MDFGQDTETVLTSRELATASDNGLREKAGTN